MRILAILLATLAMALSSPPALAKSDKIPPGQAAKAKPEPAGQAKGKANPPGPDGNGPPGQAGGGPNPPGPDGNGPPGQTGPEDGGGSASDQNAAQQAVEAKEALPLTRIMSIAQTRSAGGHVINARLVRIDGVLLYQLTMLDDDGRSWREYYYARTGNPVIIP